jgi:hypothetical protein
MNANRTLVIDWLLEEGASDEAIAYALADSVYNINTGNDGLMFRLTQADKIRHHLRSLGFDIVRLPPQSAPWARPRQD